MTQLPSELEYASFIAYCPRGSGDEIERSRDVMRQLKTNRVLPSGVTMAKFVARRLLETQPEFLADFLGHERCLVPIPRSSLRKHGALWPASEVANAFHAAGLGSAVKHYLRRVRPVPKAATAAAGERPNALTHQDSIEVTQALDIPQTVTLIDDVITRGTQAMGAAWAIWRVRPDVTIRVFAVLRTISDEHEFSTILSPTSGRITSRGQDTIRRP